MASLLEGCSYINGSPQNTFVPAIIVTAERLRLFVAGDDFKSGLTKMKSVLVDFLVSAAMEYLMKRLGDTRRKRTLRILDRLATNVLANPADTRYTTLKTSDPQFRAKVTDPIGGLIFLRLMGVEQSEDGRGRGGGRGGRGGFRGRGGGRGRGGVRCRGGCGGGRGRHGEFSSRRERKIRWSRGILKKPEGEKIEYRVWNPFRSKLGAAVLGGLDNIYIKPGTKLLYLGAASGTSVSHCSDIVGPTGTVYAVEFSHRSGRDLINCAKKRTNVVPIVEDARHPHKYRMLIGMVDTIFADVAQPDQARIVGINAEAFLKVGGHFVISIKANCIDSTVASEVVFASEVQKLREMKLKPEEQITLEPYERDHAMVVGTYRTK
eukprot:82358_1